MLILAFETSAKAASVALMRDNTILAESYLNNGKTHSATMLPMAEQLLHDCDTKMADIDYLAVANGPGSFTGIRIGVSAVKGLAWASDKPICPVSTLEAMAHQLRGVHGIICAVMDARRNQVYNALFRSDASGLTRLCEDRAIALSDLKSELQGFEDPIFLVGDGSKLTYNTLQSKISTLHFPAPNLEFQHASGVCMAASDLIAKGYTYHHSQVSPNYIRLSQAERERLERENQAVKD